MSLKRVGKGLAAAGLGFADGLRRGLPGVTVERLREQKNFLLLQHPFALGTAVHATPVVSALRAAVPDARIGVAASGLAAQVFRNHPAVDVLVETVSPFQDLREAIRSLRAAAPFAGAKYVTLFSTGNERSKNIVLAMAAGASYRVGFSVAPSLMDVVLEFDPALSQIENNLRMVRALGHEPVRCEPLIVPDAATQAAMDARMRAMGLLDGRPVAALVTQTSVTQRKSWRPERFVAVARHLVERYGAHLVMVGTKQEAEAIEGLRAAMGVPSVSFAGSTDIPQLAALLRRCAVGVTLDTGPLHVGRAVGLPMVVIAPAWSPVVEWLPVGDPRYCVLKLGEMAPPPPEDYVIDEVGVEDVVGGLLGLRFR